MLNAEAFQIPIARPLPVILLVDVSGSMGEVIDTTGMRDTGQRVFEDGRWWNIVEGGISRIQVLNRACRKMVADWSNLENGEHEVDLSVITFGKSVKVELPLTPASQVNWIDLVPEGETPLGEALRLAKEMVEDRSKVPGRAYRPTVVLISDGRPDSGWEEALRRFAKEGRSSKCDRMAMGIGDGVDMTVLRKFIEGNVVDREVFSADDASAIKDFFEYVTISVSVRTQSQNPNMVPQDNGVRATVAGQNTTASSSSDDDDEEENGFF